MKKIFILSLVFFTTVFTSKTYSQCAGSGSSLTICSKESYNEGIGLGKIDLFAHITGETPGGTWTETTTAPCFVSGGPNGLNTSTGVLNIWQIRKGCVYEYTYTCSGDGSTSTVTLTLGGFPGFGTDGDVCSNDNAVNLYSFLGSNPNPDNNGDFTSFDAPPGTIIGNIFDAQAAGVGVYNITYTVPAVGTCPSRSTNFQIDAQPIAEAGTTTPLVFDETDDLSGYTAFNLATMFNPSPIPDAGGDWDDTTAVPGPANTTDGIANATDSVINLQAIFMTASGGDGILDADLVLTFRYSVYPSHPICNPEDTTDFTITIRKTIGCPTVSISYNDPFCQSNTFSEGVSISGTGNFNGGTYSATPAGLSINASTGAIKPSLSTPGTYTVTYTIPPGGGCPGAVTASAMITITAQAFASISYNSPFCQSNATPQSVTISGSGAYTGGTYTSFVGLTLNSSTGAITPSTSTPGTYTVTYTIPSGGGCGSGVCTTVVTINALPVVTANPTTQTICSGQTTGIALTSNISGTTYSWTATESNVTGVSSGTGNFISQILTATGNGQGSVIYTISSIANGCSGMPITATVTVNPIPVVYISAPIAILSGEPSNIILTSNVAGTTFNWTASQSDVSGASNGTGNTIDQVLTTTGILPGNVTYTVTPISNGCPGTPTSFSVLVLYLPGITDGTIGTDGSGNVTQPYLLDTLLSDGRYTCEWTLDGVAFRGTNGLENITTNQYSATQAGRYCVVATNIATGFRSLETCVDVTTQVLSNSEFNSLKLTYSPNPVTDVLTFESKEVLKKVTVYNTLGQKVYSNILNDLNPKIDLSSLVSGNYFVKVEGDNKQNVFQIVKK